MDEGNRDTEGEDELEGEGVVDTETENDSDGEDNVVVVTEVDGRADNVSDEGGEEVEVTLGVGVEES